MPITQARMITLANAALEYETIHENYVRRIDELLAEFIRGEIDIASVLLTINEIKFTSRPDPISVKAIATEVEHFRLMKHRNNYAARRQASKRALASQGTTAPSGTFGPQGPAAIPRFSRIEMDRRVDQHSGETITGQATPDSEAYDARIEQSGGEF